MSFILRILKSALIVLIIGAGWGVFYEHAIGGDASSTSGKTERVTLRKLEDKKDILVIFHVKDPGDVVFSHRKHVLGTRVPCDMCHGTLGDKYRKKAETEGKTFYEVIDKDYCAHCHKGGVIFSVEDDKKCSVCHHSKKEEVKPVQQHQNQEKEHGEQ